MVEKQTYEEVPQKIDEVRVSESEPKRNLMASLVVTAAVMVIGMFLYEWLRQIIHPNMATWESHLITIAFTSLLATIVAYFVLRKQFVLLQKINRKITAQEQTEEALRKAHGELERRVEERNAELVEVNKQLRGEMEGRKQADQALTDNGTAKKDTKPYLRAFKMATTRVTLRGTSPFSMRHCVR